MILVVNIIGLSTPRDSITIRLMLLLGVQDHQSPILADKLQGQRKLNRNIHDCSNSFRDHEMTAATPIGPASKSYYTTVYYTKPYFTIVYYTLVCCTTICYSERRGQHTMDITRDLLGLRRLWLQFADRGFREEKLSKGNGTHRETYPDRGSMPASIRHSNDITIQIQVVPDLTHDLKSRNPWSSESYG